MEYKEALDNLIVGIGKDYDNWNGLNRDWFANDESMKQIKEESSVKFKKTLYVKPGRKFDKVIHGTSVWGFVAKKNGEHKGISLIPSEVIPIENKNQKLKIPHIGWNEVNFKQENPLFESMVSGKDFYFVHSYLFICKDSSNIIATTPYCGGFVSAIRKQNIFGVQFHPEKSQKNGFILLKNFLSLA